MCRLVGCVWVLGFSVCGGRIVVGGVVLVGGLVRVLRVVGTPANPSRANQPGLPLISV
jgi:hypothetical protein